MLRTNTIVASIIPGLFNYFNCEISHPLLSAVGSLENSSALASSSVALNHPGFNYAGHTIICI